MTDFFFGVSMTIPGRGGEGDSKAISIFSHGNGSMANLRGVSCRR